MKTFQKEKEICIKGQELKFIYNEIVFFLMRIKDYTFKYTKNVYASFQIKHF